VCDLLIFLQVRVHPEATGAHINYRGDDLIRGHGNRPPWQPAGKLSSSAITLETFDLARLAADMDTWAPRRRNCYAPCADAASDAPVGSRIR